MAEDAEPLTRACELVGRFLYHFSRVEQQLDLAITKLFKLDPEYAPIVTANIDFSRKVNIVQTAVGLQVQKSGKSFSIDVDKTFGAIKGMNDPPRQTVAHSLFDAGEPDGVQFKRTVARGKLDVKDPFWRQTEFEKHFSILRRLQTELQTIIVELEPERIEWPPSANVAPLVTEGGFFVDADFVGHAFLTRE